MQTPTVVITGLGAVSPLGLNVDQMWAGLSTQKSGIDKITAFDATGYTCQIAGQVDDFKIGKNVPKHYRKATKLMSRDIELSVLAAKEAFENSGLVTKGLDPENINVNPERTAIIMGAGLISCELDELGPAIGKSTTDGKFDIKKWGKDGLNEITPLWLLKYLPNMLPCHVAIIHDIQGISNTITCAEAGSLLAIAEAVHIIQRNSADVAVAGGCEAKVNPMVILRQCLNKRANAECNDDPQNACRPFDADAKGSVFGEGAGLLILENAEHAKNRGAKIYAEIAGIAESNTISPDYKHLEPDGKGVQIAIEKALAQAGIEAKDLDLIIPHGTAIPQDDLAEAKAIEAVLGDAVSNVPVWPIKSMVSNTGAAAGSLDLIAGLCAMNNKTIPAAKNCDNIASGCKLNINKENKAGEIKYLLCTSYTYCGHTAAIVLKNVNGN